MVLRDGHTFTSVSEVFQIGVLVLLAFIYVQVCGFRIDGYKRELSAMPPRF
jgi:hypothetical protein